MGWFWAIVVAYLLLPLWLWVKHNIRTTCRQVFVFHPWADGGGGGEKCLWLLVKAYSECATADMAKSTTYQASAGRIRYKKPVRITLFCHATTPHIQDLLSSVGRNFGIHLPSYDNWQSKSRNTVRLSQYVSLRLVRLQTAGLAVKRYAFATQLLQLAAGVLVGYEAALRTRGNRYDYIWDTSGLPTSVAWFNWLTTFMRRRCYAYIHYPFLSHELVNENQHKRPTVRRVYNQVIKGIYSSSSQCFRQPIVVNSTFTYDGIRRLWPNRSVVKVLPPVDLSPVGDEDETPKKENIVISVSQFRPEKRHLFQVEIIKALLKRGRFPVGTTRILMCGSCRPRSASVNDEELVIEILNALDQASTSDVRVELHCHTKMDSLKWSSKTFCLKPKVIIEVHVNAATRTLWQFMRAAKVGLHTMEYEHLGISVAELALSGIYTVAHNSGGPRNDILAPLVEGGPPLGALCDSLTSFVEAIEHGLDAENNPHVQQAIADAPAVIRRRFPSNADYGQLVLRAWNLYAL